MKRSQLYIILFVSIIFLPFLLTVIPNVLINEYKVFRIFPSNWEKGGVNERFAKIEYLKKHRELNAFIFGTSRANAYDPKMAEKLSGFKYYNMSASLETIPGIYRELLWLKKMKRLVKQVILVLDFDALFYTSKGDNVDSASFDLLRLEHPEVSGDSWGAFYGRYVSHYQWKGFINDMRQRFFEDTPLRMYFDQDIGRLIQVAQNQEMAEDPESFIKDRFKKFKGYRVPESILNDNIEHFRKLIHYLDEENIDRIIIVNLAHRVILSSFYMDQYEHWLKSVLKICPTVWSFSGYNSIALNDYLFYDSSHFRPEVGNLILSKIFGNDAQVKDYPEDFGFIIDSENLGKHINKFKEDWKKIRLAQYKNSAKDKFFAKELLKRHN